MKSAKSSILTRREVLNALGRRIALGEERAAEIRIGYERKVGEFSAYQNVSGASIFILPILAYTDTASVWVVAVVVIACAFAAMFSYGAAEQKKREIADLSAIDQRELQKLDAAVETDAELRSELLRWKNEGPIRQRDADLMRKAIFYVREHRI